LVGIDSVEDVLSTFIAADGDLVPFLKDAPTVTDDRPAIEYFNGYASGWIPYGEPMGLRRPVEPFLAGPIDSAALRNAIEVTDAAGLVEDLRRRGEWDEANRVVAAARDVAPENRYLEFLERMEDYPRKRKDVNATRSPRPRPSPAVRRRRADVRTRFASYRLGERWRCSRCAGPEPLPRRPGSCSPCIRCTSRW
jgi:hypothetical protein